MQVLLTHTGHRWCFHQLDCLAPGALPDGMDSAEWHLLLDLLQGRVIPVEETSGIQTLLDRGLVELSSAVLDARALKLRMERNPLEHLERVVIEFTTACDLHCLHCRNGTQKVVTEPRPERLCMPIDELIGIGIRRFDFIGGEVIRFGSGWLDVVRHIRSRKDTTVGVVTNGSFLGARNFQAAGLFYQDDRSLMKEFAAAGVTHLIFSLDGPRALHDRWRGVPGLYDRVLNGIRMAHEAGLQPQVSIINRPYREDPEVLAWLIEVSEALCGPEASLSPDQRIHRLLSDAQNYVSNLVDIGNAAGQRKGHISLSAIRDQELRCKNFFRMAPSLRLNATGEVTSCPLMGAAPGFGNFHRKTVTDILNGIHTTSLYRMHAEHRLGDYRQWLDPSLFVDRIDHICTLRVALTLLGLNIECGIVDPSDQRALREANLAIAKDLGIAPLRDSRES